MANISEYEEKLNAFTEDINSKKEQIAEAEKNLIIVQTKLENYNKQLKELEEECVSITGKPINELDNVIKDTLTEIEQLMDKINTKSDDN